MDVGGKLRALTLHKLLKAKDGPENSLFPSAGFAHLMEKD